MSADNKIKSKDPTNEEIKSILELLNANKFIEANKEIDKKLIKHPESSILFNILGAVLSEQNKLEEALKNYNQSIKINPNYFQAYNNLGACLHKLGRIDEAIKKYQKAIEIKSEHADSYNNLGVAYKELGEYLKSITHCQKAIDIEPQHTEAHINLGAVFKELKEYKKSIQHYEKAISIKPESFVAYSNLGNVYKALGDYNKAITYQQKAIQINSKYADAHYNLGTTYDDLNEFENVKKSYQKAIEIQPDHQSANNNLLFNLCWSNDDKQYLKTAKKYHGAIKKYESKQLANIKTSSEEILNIGFISGDFRNHPVSFFMIDTLKHLRKKKLKLFAYYNNSVEDNITQEIKKYFDKWTLVFYKTNKDLVNLIRKDNIDIFFDLSGHTLNNRLPIFKNRCAPVQASWCGWLASSGIKEIDYIIGDKYATPLSDQERFTEKIYQLKNIWECLSISHLDSENLIVRNNNEKNIIFGSLVNIEKANDSVIKLWSKILNAVTNSKLFLKCNWYDIPKIREKIIKKFENNNVNKSQLIIEGKTSRIKHIESYNKIDIVLDTFPASGGTTSFEASYMGAPILTKISENNFWFRTGESINKNLNMDNWIAKDEDDYFKKAVNFSESKKYLVNLKNEIRNFSLKSPLFDSKNYSDDFYEMLLSIKK